MRSRKPRNRSRNIQGSRIYSARIPAVSSYSLSWTNRNISELLEAIDHVPAHMKENPGVKSFCCRRSQRHSARNGEEREYWLQARRIIFLTDSSGNLDLFLSCSTDLWTDHRSRRFQIQQSGRWLSRAWKQISQLSRLPALGFSVSRKPKDKEEKRQDRYHSGDSFGRTLTSAVSLSRILLEEVKVGPAVRWH